MSCKNSAEFPVPFTQLFSMTSDTATEPRHSQDGDIGVILLTKLKRACGPMHLHKMILILHPRPRMTAPPPVNAPPPPRVTSHDEVWLPTAEIRAAPLWNVVRRESHEALLPACISCSPSCPAPPGCGVRWSLAHAHCCVGRVCKGHNPLGSWDRAPPPPHLSQRRSFKACGPSG